MPVDKSNYLKCLEDFAKQCRQALEIPKGKSVTKPISKIVVCGMGGSAIGGSLLKTYLAKSGIPVEVVRGYTMPPEIDDKTLVFCVSYSGNTEETLECYSQAKEKNCVIWSITSGGKLGEMCENVLRVPSGQQPRASVGYLFLPMLGLLYNSGVVSLTNAELNETIAMLKNIDDFKDKGDELAKSIGTKIPVIYASTLLEPLAYRFKTQVNENAKRAAYWHVFPEMNHNELNAYMGMERGKYVAIVIRDDNDHPRIKKRMDICKEIMERNVDVVEVYTKGDSLLARMFYAICVGDYASYYLAIRDRTDPTPVEVIEDLKKALKD